MHRILPLLQCDCGFSYAADGSSSSSRFESPAYYELLAAKDAFSRTMFSRWSDKIADMLPRGGRVLDVGFGFGAFLSLMANAGFAVYGVEVSEPFCRHLRERLPGATVFHGSLTSWAVRSAVPPNSFDLVSFWDCLQYISDADAQLRVADSLLRDGGILAIEVPNRNLRNLQYAEVLSCIHPRLARAFLHLPAARIFFPTSNLKQRLNAQGYDVVAESAPQRSFDVRIPKSSFTGTVLALMYIGWQIVARLFDEAGSTILICRKR
jgi:SAM-dependent methyltransferase